MCALIATSVLASAAAYSSLSDTFVSHWNAAGKANGTMAKPFGAFFVPGLMIVLLGIFRLLPKIDPLKANLEASRKSYDLLCLAVFGFFAYVHGIILAWNLGVRFDFGRWMIPAFAGLWYALGLALAGIRRNWFIGIRTPWTLANDEVWEKTHRFGARFFKATALLMLAGWFLPDYAVWLILSSTLSASIGSVAYSYFVWKHLLSASRNQNERRA